MRLMEWALESEGWAFFYAGALVIAILSILAIMVGLAFRVWGLL